jgi:hypothetical protein
MFGCPGLGQDVVELLRECDIGGVLGQGFLARRPTLDDHGA